MAYYRTSLMFFLLCAIIAPSFGSRSHPSRLNRSKLNLLQSDTLSDTRSVRQTSQNRLPNDTTPDSYVVELHSNIHQRDFTYSGSVEVHVRVLQTTHSIVLNSLGVRVVSATVKNANQNELVIASIDVEPRREVLTIRTVSELTQGVYELTILFENILRDDGSGFYWSSYYAQGEERFAAVTQFQPVDARTAFPCYDEPGIRATFTIIINSGVDMKVHSNMPVASIKMVGNGIKQTRFQPTPRMPTYLVAFAITSDFVSIRTSLKSPPSNINMELLTRPSMAIASAQQFGLQQGAAAIRAVEQYFNQSYELPKLDQLAVPDLSFAAMENWGLVIYEERYLLYDESTDMNRDKENVIATIVHEVVHQFLGNLLTPHWWSDLFLSEGFATLYEYYMGNELDPSIRFKDAFTVEALQTALLVDSTANIRPLSYEVDSRGDIERMFDIISYQKGGSVLRMFHHALGEQTFQKGVRHYISTNKGRSVTPDDLFASLDAAAKEDAVLPLSFDLASLMQPWIYQSGYPLVTVELHGEELLFRQEHYLHLDENTPTNRTWWIPITYDLLSGGATQRKQFWMPQGTSQVSLMDTGLSEDTHVLLNPQQTGYYRVNYDMTLWQRLIGQLISNPTSIPPVSRGQLIDDCLKLFLNGRVDSPVLFSLLQYISQETDAIPWTVALASDNLGALRGALIPDRSAYEAFANFLAVKLTNVFNLVLFDALSEDPHEFQQLRSLIIEWSCRMGLADCRTEALARMLNDFAGTVPIPAYLRESVYCGGATVATPAQLEAVWQRLRTVTNYQERSIIIDTLGCAESEQFLDIFLGSLFDSESVYMAGEWQLVLSAVYRKSSAGFEAMDRWLTNYTLQILLSIGTDPAFLDILADINQRRDNIGRYNELIQLLKQF